MHDKKKPGQLLHTRSITDTKKWTHKIAGIIDKNKLDLNVYYLEMVQVRTKIDSSNIASYIILRVEVHVNFDHIKILQSF